ncbi:MAG TPA: hypothetical protein VGR37_21820 [Longimicrobiaceae bacterium]|nr:hypothetical protein [Longimicrobiaceae bacterium]
MPDPRGEPPSFGALGTAKKIPALSKELQVEAELSGLVELGLAGRETVT